MKAAVLDYVEAIYVGQPQRLRRSVHPQLTKLGYYPSGEGGEEELKGEEVGRKALTVPLGSKVVSLVAVVRASLWTGRDSGLDLPV